MEYFHNPPPSLRFMMHSENDEKDGKSLGDQSSSVGDEGCSSLSSVNSSSQADQHADPSSKSHLRREALRQSQLSARGQQQHRRTSSASTAPGAYYSSSQSSSTTTTTTSTPRHAERQRTRPSLLQAKADIVAGVSIESNTEDGDCSDEASTRKCEVVSCSRKVMMAKPTTLTSETGQELHQHWSDSAEKIHHQSDATLECGHLPVALTVEDTTQWLPAAVEYDPDAKPNTQRFYSRVRPLMCCVTLSLLCGTIAVILTVTGSQSSCGSGCLAREFIGIQEFVSLFLGETVSLDKDPQSAYTKALHWILHEDPQQLDLGSSGRLLQRFVLSSVYYASDLGEGHSVPNMDVPWLSEESECEWDGVTCDSLGQVRSIDIFDFDRELWIRSIPNAFWKLPFIQKVALPFGTLENADTPFGSIDGAELKHLSTLNLRGNNLGADTSDDANGHDAFKFRTFRSLKHADLGQNKLQGKLNATAIFSRAEDVKVLLLDDNKFSGSLPIQEDSKFHNLLRLNVAQNEFSGTIFRSFSELPRVKEVMLDGNLFDGPLPELDPDSTLAHFEAGNNRFNGTIPESLVSSSSLVHLGLSSNLLNGVLPPIRASRLRHFDVHGNMLSGSLEGFDLGDEISSLVYYDISLNRIEGSMESVCTTRRFPSTIVSDCLDAIECSCCTKCCDSGTGRCNT